MQRFFISSPLLPSKVITFSSEISHQCRKVLRYKGLEKVILVDQSGNSALAEIIIEENNVKALVLELLALEESTLEITLIQGLIKKERWEYFLQKATEVGVSRIIPLKLERNVVKWEKDEIDHKLERYQKILIEAAEQSHRTSVPILERPIELKDLYKYQSELNFVAYEGEKTQALKKALHPVKSITMILGAEGGISEREHQAMLDQGFTSVHLGPRILRAETAGIVACTILQTVLES